MRTSRGPLLEINMQYEYKCDNCTKTYTINCSIKDHVNTIKCPKCVTSFAHQVINSCPALSIPSNMSHDGKSRFLGQGQTSSASSEQARVPINIIDENPDGSCKVTRIGRKQDIENE